MNSRRFPHFFLWSHFVEFVAAFMLRAGAVKRPAGAADLAGSTAICVSERQVEQTDFYNRHLPELRA
jgi:hypothetical protein